jgi:hypothetical protein
MKPQRRKLNLGQLWKLTHGRCLRVLSGEVWVTWEDGGEDRILSEGSGLDLRNKKEVLIEPLRSAKGTSALIEFSDAG